MKSYGAKSLNADACSTATHSHFRCNSCQIHVHHIKGAVCTARTRLLSFTSEATSPGLPSLRVQVSQSHHRLLSCIFLFPCRSFHPSERKKGSVSHGCWSNLTIPAIGVIVPFLLVLWCPWVPLIPCLWSPLIPCLWGQLILCLPYPCSLYLYPSALSHLPFHLFLSPHLDVTVKSPDGKAVGIATF
jgi:hypothetical protein